MAKKRPSPPNRETIDFTKLPPEEAHTRLAELDLLLVSMGAGIASPGRGEAQKLFAPYRALGFVDEVREMSERLCKLSDEYHSLFPAAWPDEDHKALKDHLEKLERSFDVLRSSEKRLRGLGWKFDRETGDLKRIRKSEGKSSLGEHVWGIYRARYVGKGKGKGNTEFVRRKIATELASIFDASKLSPKSGAYIYRAIYDREKRGR